MDSYHGRELRKGRHSEPGRVYLLTSVTHCRRPYFNHWQTGRLLVSQLRHSDNDGLTHTLAYVVMPDHLHWLVELKTGCLSDVMRRIKSRSAIDINRRLGGKGKIWQSGYHDHAVRQEEDLRGMARYVVANPLRAELVSSIGDYPLWDAAWP